ncbi:MAG: cupin domain-containing protein [Acidobacteriota bacterium]|nr:cupin domain-containing protein [Acidobacteriota bacterium]
MGHLQKYLFTSSFWEDQWNKRAVHIGERLHNSLVSESEIQTLIRMISPDSDRIQFALEGRYLDNLMLTRGEQKDQSRPQIFDALRVEDVLRKGATLIVNGIDEIHEDVGLLANELETFVGVRVQCNLYACWGSDPGFGIHWDEHEVLALQLTGQKEWRLYGATASSPVRFMRERNERPGVAHTIINLEQGSLLYVPRGEWHSVHPSGEPAIHLAIGIHNSTGIHLGNWIAKQLAETGAGRSDLPLYGSSQESIDKFANRYKPEIEALINVSSVNAFMQERILNLTPRHFVRIGGAGHYEKLIQNPATLLYLYDPRAALERSDGCIILHEPNRRIILKEEVLPVLVALQEETGSTIQELQLRLTADVVGSHLTAVLIELMEIGVVFGREG